MTYCIYTVSVVSKRANAYIYPLLLCQGPPSYILLFLLAWLLVRMYKNGVVIRFRNKEVRFYSFKVLFVSTDAAHIISGFLADLLYFYSFTMIITSFHIW